VGKATKPRFIVYKVKKTGTKKGKQKKGKSYCGNPQWIWKGMRVKVN